MRRIHISIKNIKSSGRTFHHIVFNRKISEKAKIKQFSTTNIEFEVLSEPAPGNPFHLAIPVHNISIARQFYGNLLGLKEGRRAADDKWQDYSMNGHQIVCHYVGENYRCIDYYNPVDGDEVPVPHFGIILSEIEFLKLAEKLNHENINYIVPPHKRFIDQPGEQWTMFFKDPSGNNLEFKALTNPNYLFAKYSVKT